MLIPNKRLRKGHQRPLQHCFELLLVSSHSDGCRALRAGQGPYSLELLVQVTDTRRETTGYPMKLSAGFFAALCLCK